MDSIRPTGMNTDLPLLRTKTLVLVVAVWTMTAGGAPIVTVRNSTVSVPAALIVSVDSSAATNLAGSNFMLSAVAPATPHGGRASLVSSPEWVRGYRGSVTGSHSAYAMAVRADGSIVVTGPSAGVGTALDFATICYTADGVPLWTNRYDGPNHGGDTPRFLAINGSGEVWVAGDSMRYATNSTLKDVALVKYAAGGVPLWTNRYSSLETNGAYPTALAVDELGNAYVQVRASYWTGFTGTLVEDVLVKYDAQGNVVWTKSYPRTAPDSGQGLHTLGPMALDDSGNLFVAGVSGGQFWNTGSSIVKFTSDGTALWTNHHPFGAVSQFQLLSVDRQGNAIVTGERWGDGTWNYVVIKCSKDGASLWTNVLTGPTYTGGNVPQTLADPAGNVFLIGGTPGASPGLYRILKVNSEGIPLWTNQTADFGITNSMISRSAVDSAGNLYLTGHAPGAESGYRDFVTMKYAADGLPLWTNRFNGSGDGDDFPFALAVDSAGNAYVAGRSESSAGSPEFATAKYADLLFYSPPRDFTGTDTIAYTLTDTSGNQATGSVEVLVMPGSFQFLPVAMTMTPSGLELLIEGVPGTNVVVLEASPDPFSWLPILTNAPDDGAVRFCDPAAMLLPQRFYRAVQRQ
jgi:hypothetical protein